MATMPKQIAKLSVGHTDILLPADKALKVAALLIGAVQCRYSGSFRHDMEDDFQGAMYLAEGPVRVEIEMLRSSQVIAPASPKSKPRALPGPTD